jgi:hypothetical protein
MMQDPTVDEFDEEECFEEFEEDQDHPRQAIYTCCIP